MSDGLVSQFEGRAQLRHASDLLSRYVLPLYTDENNRPVHAGSAFIVRAQGHYFLVTAAHVLDRLADGNLYFYVTPREVRAVEGKGYCTPGNPKDRRNDDRLDVGVVCLRNGVYPPYPLVDKSAIDIHELAPQVLPRPSRDYLVVGFPTSKNKANPVKVELNAIAYAYHGKSPAAKAYEKTGAEQRYHVLIEFEQRLGYDTYGLQVTFPKPQGMSGSPVWLYDAGEPLPFDTFGFPVVAVATAHRVGDGLLEGTDISVAIGMIGDLLARVVPLISRVCTAPHERNAVSRAL
jgi:hypothetical protein